MYMSLYQQPNLIKAHVHPVPFLAVDLFNMAVQNCNSLKHMLVNFHCIHANYLRNTGSIGDREE